MGTIAQLANEAARHQALAQGLSLLLVVLGLMVGVFAGLIVYAAVRRRRARVGVPRRAPTQRVDAWSLAAQRVTYEAVSSSEYEDEDDDVDESTWYDEGEDDDDEGSFFDPDRTPPSFGPMGDQLDDDSFNDDDDDIPGRRLDF